LRTYGALGKLAANFFYRHFAPKGAFTQLFGKKMMVNSQGTLALLVTFFSTNILLLTALFTPLLNL